VKQPALQRYALSAALLAAVVGMLTLPANAATTTSHATGSSVGDIPVFGAQRVAVSPTVGVSHGLAVDGAGDLFDVDFGAGRVLELPVGGDQLLTLPFPLLSGPTGVAVDTRGDVVVADTGDNRVLELAAGQTVAKVLPFSGLSGPTGVAIGGSGAVYVADTGNNRIEALPAGSASAVTLEFTGLSQPSAVAVGPGGVYVADTGNNQIVGLNLTTGTQITLPFPFMSAPTAVAADPAGDVFTTLDGRNVPGQMGEDPVVELAPGATEATTLPIVQKYSGTVQGIAVDANGGVYTTGNGSQINYLAAGASDTKQINLPGIFDPTALDLDSAGDLFICQVGITVGSAGGVVEQAAGSELPVSLDSGSVSVPTGMAVVTAKGKWSKVYLSTVGSQPLFVASAGSDEPQYVAAADGSTEYGGVTVTSAGHVYVTEPQHGEVLELSGVGPKAKRLAFSGLSDPTSVAVDKAGDVYVVDAGHNRVVELPAGSSKQRTLAFRGLSSPRSVAVDRHDDVFVADGKNHRVLELAAGARSAETLPFVGLSIPSSVAVDHAGDVYVADTYNGRVVELPFVGNRVPAFPSYGVQKGKVGVKSRKSFEATGYPTPRDTRFIGRLPAGLRLNSKTGVISGTPTKAGKSFVLLTATNRAGTTVSPQITFRISR
jgi:sugar lactone lactonase YvrE